MVQCGQKIEEALVVLQWIPLHHGKESMVWEGAVFEYIGYCSHL